MLQTKASTQLLDALNSHGVTAQDFEMDNETIMTAKNGSEWSMTKPDGTAITLIKNNDTSFNIKTDKE
jgi:hypothetical protein